MPLQYLLSFGRLLSERSARECVRRGEVAILRVHEAHSPVMLRCRRWARLAPATFELALLIEKVIGVVPLHNLDSTLVQRLETLMTTLS